MIFHQTPAVNLYQTFPRPFLHIWTYDVHRFEMVTAIRVCRCGIVEYVQVVDESDAIFVIHEEMTTIDATIKYVP